MGNFMSKGVLKREVQSTAVQSGQILNGFHGSDPMQELLAAGHHAHLMRGELQLLGGLGP